MAARGFAVGTTRAGTWHCSPADLRVQGNYVRTNFNDYGAFGRGWYARYPGAWYAPGFAAGVWTAATWPTINNWFGVDWASIGYDYGNNITYVDNNVYVDAAPRSPRLPITISRPAIWRRQVNKQTLATQPQPTRDSNRRKRIRRTRSGCRSVCSRQFPVARSRVK